MRRKMPEQHVDLVDNVIIDLDQSPAGGATA
jgi:hypothetical protein